MPGKNGIRRITIGASGDVFPQPADDCVLRSALRAGVGFPYECNSGGCGSCRFTLASGEVEVLWEEAPGRSARDRRKNIYLGCQTRALGDLEIDVRLRQDADKQHRPSKRQVRLAGLKDLTHDIREFQLEVEGPSGFLPGQYAIFEFDGGAVRRCYSMSNLPNEKGIWDFQIKRVPDGFGTNLLFSLKAGAELTLDGPYGLAYLRPEAPRDVLCVAGGSGLSPMISIARAIGSDPAHNEKRIHFFYGCRTVEDIAGQDYLEDLPGFGERITYHPVISLPEHEKSRDWQGATGLIHEEVDRAFGESVRDLEIYFAGPPPMAQAVQELLMLKHQVPFGQIHFDRFF